MKEAKFNESLNRKEPTSTVKIKFIPVDTGTINENCPDESALNITKADKNIIAKARITGGFNKNLNHNSMLSRTCPLTWYLMIAAPLTFKVA
jgi:hypothetical protein